MTDLPERLFKYVGPDRIDLFENLQIRFTQPARFNDPFEVLPVVDCSQTESMIEAGINEVMNRHYLTHARQQAAVRQKPLPLEDFRRMFAQKNRQRWDDLKNPERLQNMATARWQKSWDTVGILSLTATEKNLLMWSHYCQSHEGMVIEFEPRHAFFNPTDRVAGCDFGILTKVQYSKTRPRVRFGSGDGTLALVPFYTKGDVWAYETEWRVFQLLERSAKAIPQANETIHLFGVPPKCIKRVIIGCRMDVKRRARLAYAIDNNPKLKHVQIWAARQDPNKFALSYSPWRQ